MKRKGCLTSLGGFILVGAAIWGGWHLYAYIRYAPKVNPHPKYFMTIKGHIDPKLDKALKLQWVTTYYSTNPACEVWPDGKWNEGGVKAARSITLYYKANINYRGNYTLAVPLDKYKSGFCKWRSYSFVIKTMPKKKQPSYLMNVDFSTGKNSHGAGLFDYQCSQDSCWNVNHPRLLDTLTLNPNSNHQLIINIKRGHYVSQRY